MHIICVRGKVMATNPLLMTNMSESLSMYEAQITQRMKYVISYYVFVTFGLTDKQIFRGQYPFCAVKSSLTNL